MGGEENAQRNRKRQHPLPDRHARDDLIDQVRGALRHAPRAARGAKPASLAGKRHQLLVGAISAAHAQKTVGQDAAFEKGLELVFDKRRQARTGFCFNLGEEGLKLFLHHLIERRFLRAPPLVEILARLRPLLRAQAAGVACAGSATRRVLHLHICRGTLAYRASGVKRRLSITPRK